jgi:signal transduction histidine kinase
MRRESVVWGRDGSPLPVELSVEPVLIAREAAGAIVTLRDLREDPGHIEALMAQMPAGIVVTDASPGRVDRSNLRLTELFGIDGRVRCQLNTVHEWPMQHLSGGTVAFDEHPLCRAFVSGERIQAEKYVIRTAAGERTVSVNASPIAYSGQKVRGAIAVFTDVTEREAMIRRLEQANDGLKQSHSDLRRFALVAAHDLKEPLATIRKHTESIAACGTGGTDVEDCLRSISGSCHRLTGVANHMLTVAHFASAPLRLEITRGETLARMAISQLQAKIEREHARVTIGPMPDVFGDQIQITRVLQNLI